MTRYAPTPEGRAAAQAAMNATGTTMGPRRPAVVRPGVPTGPRRPVVDVERPRPGPVRDPVRPLPGGVSTFGPRGSGPNDGGPRPRPGMGGPKTPIGGVGFNQQTLGSNGNVVTMKRGGKVKSKAMRGGGLARKGVGMALAKGGLAKRAGGIAKRGVGRGKMC